MRKLEVVFRPEARKDLADIFDLVLRLSADVAVSRRFVGRIRERCRRIGDVPYGGRPRHDLAVGLRTVPFERSAVVANTVVGDRVVVTIIFYGLRRARLRGFASAGSMIGRCAISDRPNSIASTGVPGPAGAPTSWPTTPAGRTTP